MARRSKQDAQLTRDAILDAAARVFRDKGVARTRMEDILQLQNPTDAFADQPELGAQLREALRQTSLA